MFRESIQIIYSGPAVDSGQMDVSDLGPALFFIGELCSDANRILNGPDSVVSVKVKADFQKGSFRIDLDVIKNLLESLRDMFSGDSNSIGMDKLIELIFGAGSVIAALKWLKGEKDPITTTLKDGSIKLEVTGKNNHIIVNSHIAPLLRDPKIRKSIDNIVRPLSKKDINSFSVKRQNKTIQTINKSEAKYLIEDGTDINKQLGSQDVTRTAYLEIIKLSFKEQNQWTFSDGSGTFSASIEDRIFLQKVDQRERFGKGDQLKVLLKTTTSRLANGKWQARHIIVQVLEIIRSSQTIMFEK